MPQFKKKQIITRQIQMLKLIIPYLPYHNKKGTNSIHLHIHPLGEISKAVSILFLTPTVNFFLDFIPFFPYQCRKTIEGLLE